ncbi:MAG TPA: response regulator transcription factor [Chitinispirillaceae bacterium]|nr:response regulator transcription factor [Chitinispirillaceae bacterium]
MDTKNTKRIIVVDDHPIVCEGIVRLIERTSNMKVCGQTGDGKEVMGLISKLKPDALILDLSLESSDGLGLLDQITSRYPEIPVLILSMHNEMTHAPQCIKAGARGYLMKECASARIVTALNDIFSGKIYISESVQELIVKSFADLGKTHLPSVENLSPREFQIFRLYGKGLGSSQIAEQLHCSPKTIATHTIRIRKKLEKSSTNELIAYAGAYMNSF